MSLNQMYSHISQIHWVPMLCVFTLTCGDIWQPNLCIFIIGATHSFKKTICQYDVQFQRFRLSVLVSRGLITVRVLTVITPYNVTYICDLYVRYKAVCMGVAAIIWGWDMSPPPFKMISLDPPTFTMRKVRASVCPLATLCIALCQCFIIKSIPLAYCENAQINETPSHVFTVTLYQGRFSEPYMSRTWAVHAAFFV